MQTNTNNKIALFEKKQIRKIWHDKEWYFSVVDIVGALTDSIDPKDYWYRLKKRANEEEEIELSTICRQLKVIAPDGKMRATDCSNTEGILRIIQSIPSPKAEPFKRWLAKVGYERIEEIENPEHFIKEVSRIIQEQKATTLINHITYNQTGQIYEDDVFTINNLRGELGKNIQEVKRHIYSYVKTDSEIEYRFADDLEKNNENILVYAKLPRGFFIPTPVGNYNPDWAIVFYERNIKHIYFIAETKGSLSSMQLKTVEKLKIDYAKKHFEALGHDSVIYDVVDTYQHLMDKVMR
jgi:hypothetical protein